MAPKENQKSASDFDALDPTGCGTLRLLRALGGTRILQAAAPTAPPCIRRRRRSSPLQTRGCSPLSTPKERSKRKNASRFAQTGCGAQRPLRALSGTRVLLTAAPTAPPCIRRWRRSSPLQTRGCSPLSTPKERSKRKNASRFAQTGCGAQRPLRALSGTRVLLTAAPTAPPCIRRWRRSSPLHFFRASPI